jgi:hypothetical protein
MRGKLRCAKTRTHQRSARRPKHPVAKPPTTQRPGAPAPAPAFSPTVPPLVPSAPPATVSADPYANRVGLAVTHDLLNASTNQIEAQFAQIRAGGVSWVRSDLSWAVAEPQDGVFNWAPFDRLMTAASQAGVQVLGILDYSAPWASSDPSGAKNEFYPPNNDADFAAYAAAVASRYGSSGSFWKTNPQLKPAPLAALEIWNEPYGSWFWKPGPNPTAYAALVRQTAPAIHVADPKMQVLMSGNLMNGTQQPWLAQVLAAQPSVGGLVDGLDVHPYPTVRTAGPYDSSEPVQDSFGQIPLARQTELAAGVDLPIWITEIGWSTAPDTPTAVSSQTQATFLTGAVQRAVGEWGTYVPKVFLYGWLRSTGNQGDWDGNLGLLDPSGNLTPAWDQLAQMLGGVPGAADPSPWLS